MARVLIVHTSWEDQARRVSERLAEVLRRDGHELRLEPSRPFPGVGGADAVLIVAALRGGRRSAALTRAVRAHATVLKYIPSAFLAVCPALSCEDPHGRARADDELHAFLERTGWKPDLAAGIQRSLRARRPFGTFRRSAAPAEPRGGAPGGAAGGNGDSEARRLAEAFSTLLKAARPRGSAARSQAALRH